MPTYNPTKKYFSREGHLYITQHGKEPMLGYLWPRDGFPNYWHQVSSLIGLYSELTEISRDEALALAEKARLATKYI